MKIETMWMSLRAIGLLAPGVLCAADTLTQQPVQLRSPASGSESAGPFPGFSWSWHPAAFKDMGRTVEYEIRISSNETDWPNGLYASEIIVRHNTIMSHH
jgi:hypothetical protein